MSSLQQTATIELLKSELKALIGAAEQSEFFADNGSEFEKRIARKYLIDKALRARDFLNKINEQESQEKTGT